MNKTSILGIIGVCIVMIGISDTFALGTWNTGYRISAGGNTTTATNTVNICDNNYALDVLIPMNTTDACEELSDTLRDEWSVSRSIELTVNGEKSMYCETLVEVKKQICMELFVGTLVSKIGNKNWCYKLLAQESIDLCIQ